MNSKNPQSQDPLLGAIIGKTRIGKCIGIGGMGAVYRGQNILQKNKSVAIKILHSHLAHDRKQIKRFLREANSVAKLNSRHIIQVESVGRDSRSGLYYIVMELIDGETLAEKIKRQQKLDIDTTLEYFEQIINGLEVAHGSGIYHRDLKPANILIDNNNIVKIGDFGLAKVVEGDFTELTQSGQLLGTASYMAPEQFTDNRADARTDIYALGVTFYQALTGQLPFDAATPLAFGMKKCSQDPPSPQDIRRNLPAAVNTLALKMIAREPRERYQSVAEVREAIFQIKEAQSETFLDSKHPPDSDNYQDATCVDLQIDEITRLDLQSQQNRSPQSQGKSLIGRARHLANAYKPVISKLMHRFRPDKQAPEAIGIDGFVFVRQCQYTCGKAIFTVKEYRHQPDNKQEKATGMIFVLVPGGSLQMGSSRVRHARPVHMVMVNPFLISKHVVTQGVWYKVMGDKPWQGQSFARKGRNYPAVYISWNQAKEFCCKTGLALPGEAQWEYACRAGTNSDYYWGDSMDKNYCWYYDNTTAVGEEYPHKVGQKKANAFGLLDMAGNVWEWCEDAWHDSYRSAPNHDAPWLAAAHAIRLIRGGGWDANRQSCRSASRDRHVPTSRVDNLGFRLVKTLI